MKKPLFILTMLIMSLSAIGQQNARNGCSYPTSGELRFFIVFADVVDDTLTGIIPHWNAGALPDYADDIIDVNNNSSFVSYLSRYYNEASFGALKIVADYYPQLIQFHSNEINREGIDAVMNYLNELDGNDINTAHNYHLTDFDHWTFG